MGFDVEIIARVSYHEGNPYTYINDKYDYLFEIPTIPDDLKAYTSLRGHFWSQFFDDENWMDTSWFLDKCMSDWECLDDQDDDYREEYEKVKELLEWCSKQNCHFMIGWY